MVVEPTSATSPKNGVIMVGRDATEAGKTNLRIIAPKRADIVRVAHQDQDLDQILDQTQGQTLVIAGTLLLSVNTTSKNGGKIAMTDGTRKIAKNHAEFAIKMKRANKMFSPSWK